MGLRTVLLGIVAVPLIAHAVDGPKRELVGITPWQQTESERASDIRIMHNRVGPMACPKRARLPYWKRLLMNKNRWCDEWTARREEAAAFAEGEDR